MTIPVVGRALLYVRPEVVVVHEIPHRKRDGVEVFDAATGTGDDVLAVLLERDAVDCLERLASGLRFVVRTHDLAERDLALADNADVRAGPFEHLDRARRHVRPAADHHHFGEARLHRADQLIGSRRRVRGEGDRVEPGPEAPDAREVLLGGARLRQVHELRVRPLLLQVGGQIEQAEAGARLVLPEHAAVIVGKDDSHGTTSSSFESAGR
jgi:hypothetical protein